MFNTTIQSLRIAFYHDYLLVLYGLETFLEELKMANRCEKISESEQRMYDAYREIIMQYNDYPLPEDSVQKNKEFAERLRIQMDRKGMNQAELSRESGASATTIAKLLKGTTGKVSEVHIYLFAAILNCSPHYLLGLVDTPGGVCSPDGKKGFIPFTFFSTPEIKFLETMRNAAREDREFVDYIYQIVSSGADRMTDVKKILEASHFVAKKEPVPTPQSWNNDEKL